jgi:hypothetical protein
VRQVARLVTLALVGTTLGGIVGSIITGDWIYTIVWAVSLPLIFFLVGAGGVVAASAEKRRRRGSSPPLDPAGIISSSPGAAPRPSEAVLNPEPTAVPAGTVLNGVPVDPGPEESPVAVSGPPRPRVPWWNRALAIVIIAAAAAATLIPAYRLIGWKASDLAQGRWDSTDMRTSLHQQEAVDDIAEIVGGYEFTGIGFYDGYLIVDAPTYPGAATTDTYMWRYGRAWREGPEFIQPTDVEAELFDVRGVDLSIVGELVEWAKDDTGWSDLESWYPSVSRFSDAPAEISISLSSAYFSATYRFSLTGELLDRNGTGLD